MATNQGFTVAYFNLIKDHFHFKFNFTFSIIGDATFIDFALLNHETTMKKFKLFFLFFLKVGYADYNLFEAIDIHLVLDPNCLDKFPKLKAYHAKMLERPGIKKRQGAEGFKDININGNGKQ